MIGRHSKIFTGTKEYDSRTYVIKQLKCEWNNIYQGVTRDILNELSCLITLKNYPEFVQLLSVQFTNGVVNLLFTEAICNLTCYIAKIAISERLTEVDKLKNTCLSGLKILYYNSIFHGDLKSDNILLYLEGETFYFKICDFGISKYNNIGCINDRHEYITLTYRPPELLCETADDYVFKERTCNLFKCDVWSVGIILLQMYIGNVALFRYNAQEMYKFIITHVKEGSLNVRELIPNSIEISELNLKLLKALLKIKPFDRWRSTTFIATIRECATKDYYDHAAQKEIFNICQLANLKPTIALTALDILMRYLNTSIRNIRGHEYNSIQIDPFDVIVSLKISLEFHSDVYESLFEIINLYSRYYLMSMNLDCDLSDINQQNMNYPVDSLLNLEKKMLIALDYQVSPPSLINLISIFSIMKYDYRISNRKLNNLYMIS